MPSGKITDSILLGTLLCFTFLPALYAKPLVYLYINASEGNASGGHTALQFDTETYHFQNFDGGIIRLLKQASTDFDYQYRYLGNRTVQQTTIELNDKHYDLLHHHFNLRFLREKQQDAILKEINLNLALLQQQIQDPLLSIQGAGLFVNSAKTHLSSNRFIQEYIAQKEGTGFLDTRIKRLKEKIKTLKPITWPQSALQLSEEDFLATPYSFASRHIDTVSKLLFLETLKKSTPLNQHVYFSPEHPHFILSKSEKVQLKIFQDQLLKNLLSLLNSQRPNWGSVAFTLYAHILALSQAINSGKFVFLDSYAENGSDIPYSEVERYKSLFQAQKQQAFEKIIQEKKQLFNGQKITEASYSRFEMLSNYYYERERGLKNKCNIRVSGEQRLPLKSIPIPMHLLPEITPQQRDIRLHQLKSYKKNITQQLQTLYHYNLFSRNCVTEIFTTISKTGINNKQINELTQIIEDNPLTFIPFSSYQNFSSHYQQQALPSFRQLQLTNMYQQENNILVYLREFNTLSASYYKFNDKDAPFLFFTDDKIWSRPLYGSLNLVAAATISIYGVFKFPFDSGKSLKQGGMGILMSLPELAFFNIRKGTYKYLSIPKQID